jgi:RND family efflux transporter MFP subunit
MRRKPNAKIKWRGAALLLAFAAALASGCSQAGLIGAGAAEGSREPALKTVRVEKIARQRIGDPIEVTAEVTSSLQMKVVSKHGGEVKQVLKKRGDAVKAGEPLLILSSEELIRKREVAENDLKNARSRLAQARSAGSATLSQMTRTVSQLQRSLNKAKNDYDAGAATFADVTAAQDAYTNAVNALSAFRQQQNGTLASAEAEVANAELALKDADTALSELVVKSPLSGVLTAFQIQTGMTLPDGGEAGLVEVVDVVNIKANLSAEAAKFVRGKQKLAYATADSAEGEPKKQAEVRFLASVINPDTQAYDLILEVPNPDLALKPGMKVRVQLTDESEQTAIAVPTQSILTEEDESYVFVLAGDTVQKRRVELGRVNEPLQEVLSGVKENELLVVSGQRQLTNLEKVQVLNPSATKSNP